MFAAGFPFRGGLSNSPRRTRRWRAYNVGGPANLGRDARVRRHGDGMRRRSIAPGRTRGNSCPFSSRKRRSSTENDSRTEMGRREPHTDAFLIIKYGARWEFGAREPPRGASIGLLCAISRPIPAHVKVDYIVRVSKRRGDMAEFEEGRLVYRDPLRHGRLQHSPSGEVI